MKRNCKIRFDDIVFNNFIFQSTGRDLVLFFQELKAQDAGNYTCVANYGSETLAATVMLKTYGKFFARIALQKYIFLF